MLAPELEWRTRSDAAALTRSSVHLWFAHLDHPDAVVDSFINNISSDEYKRATRFHFQRDRQRWIVARAILRQILAGYLECNPCDVSFSYGAFGKPALAGPFVNSKVRFNLAHSGSGALFAVTYGRKVGVDLELIRPLSDARSLAQECFSANENTAWMSLPEPGKLRAFFDCWTRKEAYLKATGKGLSLSLQAFDVSLEAGAGQRNLTLYDRNGDPPAWTLLSLAPHPDYSAALVVEGRVCRIRVLSRGWETAACPEAHQAVPVGE